MRADPDRQSFECFGFVALMLEIEILIENVKNFKHVKGKEVFNIIWIYHVQRGFP